jgi:hypothetical protein
VSPPRSVRILLVAAVGITVPMFVLYTSEGAQAAFVRTLGDSMEWKSRWISSRNAVNCGSVPVRGNPDAATDCALHAFASHHSFRVRYGLQTMDTVMAVGVVSAPNGHIYEIIFSGGTPTGSVDVFRQRFLVATCPTQALLTRTPRGRVTCAPRDPKNIPSAWLSEAP